MSMTPHENRHEGIGERTESAASSSGDPRVGLSLFYGAHFGHMAIVLPFLPPWIHSLGFGSVSIGVLLALMPMAKLLTPWTWGRLADLSGWRRGLLVASALVSAVAFLLVGANDRFPVLLALMAVYAFTLSPGVPFAEATALEQSEIRGFAYGRVRLWGSLAFVFVSAGYGALRDRVPGETGFWIGAALLALSALAALRLPAARFAGNIATRRAAGNRDGLPSWSGPGRTGRLWRLLAACTLMQVSHGAYYAFYSIRLESAGFSSAAVGSFWALAVVCEVLLLARIDSVIERLGTGAVLRLSLLSAAVRWIIISATSDPVFLVAAQTLHAMTYAAFHVAALREVYGMFEPSRRATGQALYSGLTYGLGIFTGTLAAGLLADRIGLPALFFASAAVALAALLLVGPASTRRGTGSRQR